MGELKRLHPVEPGSGSKRWHYRLTRREVGARYSDRTPDGGVSAHREYLADLECFKFLEGMRRRGFTPA